MHAINICYKCFVTCLCNKGQNIINLFQISEIGLLKQMSYNIFNGYPIVLNKFNWN